MASTATTTKESYNIYIKGKGKAKTFPLIFQKIFACGESVWQEPKSGRAFFIYHFPIFIAIFVVKFIIKFAIYKK